MSVSRRGAAITTGAAPHPLHNTVPTACARTEVQTLLQTLTPTRRRGACWAPTAPTAAQPWNLRHRLHHRHLCLLRQGFRALWRSPAPSRSWKLTSVPPPSPRPPTASSRPVLCSYRWLAPRRWSRSLVFPSPRPFATSPRQDCRFTSTTAQATVATLAAARPLCRAYVTLHLRLRQPRAAIRATTST